MEPLGSELFRQSAASYERTFWVPSTDEQGKETIVRDRRVQSFPEYLEIEDGCTLGLQQGKSWGGYKCRDPVHVCYDRATC